MSSESSSVETMAAAARARAKAKATKEKVVRASDDYIKRQQRLPPIKPPRVSESVFQAFPRLQELLRDGEAMIKSLIMMEEGVMRQYQKVLMFAEVRKMDDDDDGHRQDPHGPGVR